MRSRPALTLAIVIGASLCLWLACGGVDLDRRVAAQSGGKLAIDMQLAWGFAFDKGSLTISSHDADEVRVVVDTSGWGEYAVDVEVTELPDGVRVEGRVDGLLHWLFGGPTVDLSVWVPGDYSVDARIEDGPLLIEDLKGSVEARVEGDSLVVRRSDGELRLVSRGGPISVEDIEGSLDLESHDSDVQVSGVRGSLRVRSGRGRADISSVTGRADVESSSGRIEVDRVDGVARFVSDSGSIDVDGAEGQLEVRTGRGRIQVDDVEGRVLAHSGRGGIDVRFSGEPEGVIETERGSIDVEVPRGSSFDLEAATARGRVELDSDLAFEHTTAEGRADPVDVYREFGRRFAREVTARVHRDVMQGLETGNWDLDWSFDFDLPESHGSEDRPGLGPDGALRDRRAEAHERWKRFWRDGEWGEAPEWSWDDPGWASGKRAVQISGTVNGGGPPLQLRTQRGSIQIDDR
jgi:hypothetical protein